MSIETELAARGVKLTWEGAKVVVFAIAAFVIVGVLLWWSWGQRQREERLAGLEAFRESVQTQQMVSAGIDRAFDTARTGRARQDAQQPIVVELHDKETEEARREDPTVDDFLRAPIPQRLRDADARARASRRLEEDRARR